jgi:hypothetical protein
MNIALSSELDHLMNLLNIESDRGLALAGAAYFRQFPKNSTRILIY